MHIACKTNHGKFFETVANSGIPVHVFDYEAPMRPIQSLIKQGWRIAKRLKAINPDIIHSFHYSNNYGEAIAARLAGIKWIFTKKNMNWGSDGANAWKIRSLLAKTIVLQNREMKERFYPNTRKTVIIERGIDIQRFAPKPTSEELRRQLNTPEDARILVCVANFQPVKGIHFLIDAFEQLQKNFPAWHLWLVGDDSTPYGLEMHKVVSRKKLDGCIHFSGKQLDVLPYLQHAEIFVLPTMAKGEGSPVALIEAMANAKVVFGSEVPGVIDQLSHVPGHLFKPEDSADLMQKLQTAMLNTPDVNAVLGQSFRKYALAKYAIAREVKEHEELYKSLVSH